MHPSNPRRRRPGVELAAVLAVGLAATSVLGGADLKLKVEVKGPSIDCSLPPSLDTVLGHALFRYQPEGKRTVSVEPLYTSVRPAARKAEVEAELIRCLQRKAASGGGAGGGVLMPSRLIAFHFFAPAGPDEPTVQIREDLSIPRSQIDEIRAEKLLLAESLLVARGARSVQGRGWLLRTDLPEADVDNVRRAVEFAGRAFRLAFLPGAAPPDFPPVTILVFRDNDPFHQIVAFDNLAAQRGPSGGEYASWDRLAVMAADGQPIRLVERTVTHEATHHLVSELLFPGERVPPRWANEGIATFIECLNRGADPIDLSSRDKSTISAKGWRYYPPAVVFRDTLRDLQRADRLPDLGRFLGGELDASFFTSDPTPAYAVSWLLVDYLMSGEDGSLRESFLRWLQSTDAGTDGDSLATALGRPLAELEPAVWRHVRRL